MLLVINISDVTVLVLRNMLDRYVNDEFRAADTDLSNGWCFDNFYFFVRTTSRRMFLNYK